jgi:Zn-dependent peptidase ImmA (M78 family)
MDKFIPYKKWLHQHDEEIKTDFPDRPTDALAQKIDANYYTVSRRAARLGVGKSDAFMHTSWKRGGIKKGGWKKIKERAKNIEAVDKYMKEHFSDTKNEELAAYFGVDVKTIRRWARRLGLTKTEDFMKRARASAKHAYYTPEQEAYRIRRIAEVFPDADDEAMLRLAEELGVSLGTLRVLAIENGVRRSNAAITKAKKKGQLFRTKFTPEIIAALREYYPDHTNEECAEHFGVNLGSLKVVASKHGMKKSREHRSHVSRMNRM